MTTETVAFRKLEQKDYHNGFLQLLSQLTNVGDHSYEDFEKQFKYLVNDTNIVIVGLLGDKLVATGKLVIEPKFHNNFSSMGHIEDVVVDKAYRQKNIGKDLISYLLNLAFTTTNFKCYRVTLNCVADKIEFYKKCGLFTKGSEMTIYNPANSKL